VSGGSVVVSGGSVVVSGGRDNGYIEKEVV
jgi:hypothetical protein